MARAGLTGTSWIEFWTKNYHLPAAFDREHAAHDISIPICISLKSVLGLLNPQPQNKIEYQLGVSLFDAGFKQFFGRQWMGPTMSGRGTPNTKLHYNQPVYFHTSINSPQILVVVEVVGHTIGPDGRPRQIGCGWTIVRPFSSEEELLDLTRGPSPLTQKLDMYHGSPRALYFLDEPIESNQLLKPISGCQLCFSMCTHKMLRKIVPLLPENILIGCNSFVPGVQVSPGEDPFLRPQLLPEASYAMEGLSISLNPTVERFEEELCVMLSEDRASRENRQKETLSITVVERRLQVGVHNGWTYIEKPQVFNLDMLNSQNVGFLGSGDGLMRKTTASPSIRRSSRFHTRRSSMSSKGSADNGQQNFLGLKSRIQLNDLLQDPMFAVVFTLDYILSESLSDKDRKVAQRLDRAHTRTITVRWAVWNPFLHQGLQEVVTALTGGVARAPDDEFVYRLPTVIMQNQAVTNTAGGIISFRCALGAKEESLIVPQVSASHLSQLPGSMASVRSTDGSDKLLMEPSGSVDRLKPPSGRSPSRYAHFQCGDGIRQGQVPSRVGRQCQLGIGTGSGHRLSRLDSLHQLPYGASVSSSSMLGSDAGQHQLPQSIMLQQQRATQQQSLVAGMYGEPSGIPYGFPVGSFGQPPIFMPMSYPADAFREGLGSEMRDLPFTQVHHPIVLRPPSSFSGQSLSRAAYARLYSAGFPPILDRNGEPPEVLNPSLPAMVNLAREVADPLQANEIIFQFLAFSKVLPGRSSQATPSCVFFTFQFYRFPQVTTERLLLCKPDSQLSASQDNLPFVLQKLDRDGTVMKTAPGVEIRYHLDPTYMKPGEVTLFLQHLTRQTLHIDVWDGDSLLLIGSCCVDMKYLCRGGNEAVQATFELDVISSDQLDDGSGMTGDIQRGGSVRPVSAIHKSNGKLHLRIANVGHTVENKKIAAVQPLPSKMQVIVSQTAANSIFKGGQLSSALPPSGTKKVQVARANHLANLHEVATLLMTQKERKEALEEAEPTRESDAERLRKLARMNAIKSLLQEDNEKTTTILGYRQEKTERRRDLKTMEIYRGQTKHEGILSMLSQNITTEHTIFPSFASAEFLEFVLRNPYNQEQLVTLEWNDKDLKVVTEAREWRHYKKLCGLSTPMEEGMFSSKSTPDLPQIFLRPKETVHIPFKYQSFQADHSVMPQGPSNPFDKQKTTDKELLQQDESMQTRLFRVKFLMEDGKPMAFLHLRVEPQPHVIDQTFRFYHPENSFLKKSVRLPPFHTLPGAPVGGSTVNQIFLRCSDPNVILDCKPTQPGEPHDIFMKVAMGPSPQVKRFYITIYIDPFLSRPIQIWQCYVHALQRVDISCIEAQTSQISLLLKGTQATRVVRCFSSHPGEMTVVPADTFVLAAGSVCELSVGVRLQSTGNKFFILNVVDVEYHQLVRSWLVCTICRAPIVSRAFNLVLPVGGGRGCNKRITYTNPYPVHKNFKLLTDRPDLLHFKETVLELNGGASHAIGLRFNPVTQPGIAEILVFINDEEDKNEETFRVTAEYKLMIE